MEKRTQRAYAFRHRPCSSRAWILYDLFVKPGFLIYDQISKIISVSSSDLDGMDFPLRGNFKI